MYIHTIAMVNNGLGLWLLGIFAAILFGSRFGANGWPGVFQA